MKAIMILFDSLNRHFLSPYGCDWIKTPNFQRLADRAVVYDNNWVGSLPCIPARRELHTGRYNFLHRSWGPLEPFDDSMPQILRENGIYTHLITDHLHYFEEGGAGTYHSRYNSWELARGQEGDPWKADIAGVRQAKKPWFAREVYNRTVMCNEEDMPTAKNFAKAVEFVEHNHSEDNWFLTVECFDPHEPFFVPQSYKDLYPHLKEYGVDWPNHDCFGEDAAHSVLPYAALVSMCDHHLGKLLDKMDQHRLWEDTMVILCTDHGFLLGEHGCVGKVPMPGYRQVCNTPLLVWDPRTKGIGRSRKLVQTIDLPATLLEHFGLPHPPDMQGVPLGSETTRMGALFGVHSLYTCCTDGRWLLMKGADLQAPCYNYTLMPTHMHGFFSGEELARAELAGPLPFTKGLKVLRVPAGNWSGHEIPTLDLLFDLQTDPEQLHPTGAGPEMDRMCRLTARLMEENNAPEEAFVRYGLQICR